MKLIPLLLLALIGCGEKKETSSFKNLVLKAAEGYQIDSVYFNPNGIPKVYQSESKPQTKAITYKSEGNMRFDPNARISITGANSGFSFLENDPLYTQEMFKRIIDSGFVYADQKGTKVIFTYHDTLNIPSK